MKTIDSESKRLLFEAGWFAAIDAAIREAEALTGDKSTTSSGLLRTFKTVARIRKLLLRVEYESERHIS